MPEIFDGRFLGYVQCDFEVPEHFKNLLFKLSSVIQNTVVRRTDVANLMRKYAGREGNTAQLSERSDQAST